MASRIIPVDPFDLIIFGGTGDLTLRKLLPAMSKRFAQGQVDAKTRIFALARSADDEAAYKRRAREFIKAYQGSGETSDEKIDSFLASVRLIRLDATALESYDGLVKALADTPENRARVVYLAVAPQLYGTICKFMKASGLVHPLTRVVLEKPIGWDFASSERINHEVGAIFDEDTVYRIDHYLGKETVQNLMALRFANTFIEPLWSAQHIEHIQITVAEELGVEDRAAYYDKAGPLRDMVQNHLLQLLCLIAMEPPVRFDADFVRNEKLKVLNSLRPINRRNIEALTVRGRYEAGSINGEIVAGYLDEAGVSAQSTTETYVALHAEVDNWRWAGVPFFLRTGKRLAKRVSEIVVKFRALRHSIFPAGSGTVHANRLLVRLQPDEGITLEIMIKESGPGGFRLVRAPLDLSLFGQKSPDAPVVTAPDAYERLLLDVARGDQTLFMRRDEVGAAWAWVDPILSAWADLPEDSVRGYKAGTWGPSAATALMATRGFQWQEEV